jgi:chorismate synthase
MTTGAPIALNIRNRDWENWQEAMSADVEHRGKAVPVTEVRPGHADLPGVLKYSHDDARNILERSSARETASRVAAGAVAKQILKFFDIRIGSFVDRLGSVTCPHDDQWALLHKNAEQSEVRMPDGVAEKAAIKHIDAIKADGDTVGGSFICFATGLPVGLGSYTTWEGRLEARVGRAMLSVPAIKGVEIGIGFEVAELPGSQVHDAISRGGPADVRRGGYRRNTNRAGGFEGGMTNGEPVWVRAAMKPIPTLMRPLETVDLHTGEVADASRERSDVCAVPAASVVGEAMLAIELIGAMQEKFGADSVADMERNFSSYLGELDRRWKKA